MLTLLACLMLICCLPAVSLGADSFEASISAFPESYKPYLRELHEKYPNWEFQALKTGLDWSASVDAQFAYNRSLVASSTAYTDIFRSRESGDYNSSTGTYIEKDSGFVRANKIAISYYMDPRNFLNEEGIFQFEKLSFDKSITVSDVEAVLKGSFMYNTYINYYGGTIEKVTDENGKTTYNYVLKEDIIKTKEKYSQAIYEAGETYNINPCFLASKILNEVGLNGSNSVSGKQATYPGVYNFYNIAATDGGNPIEKGLQWASNYGTYESGTYGRPWITPKKSIMGGAQFNANAYINVGQYTSYLQRFNVDPDAKNKVYTHQYMTNISGAAAIAYTTYKSYLETDLISNKFVFVIPIYENMPASSSTSGTITTSDAKNQIATVNTSCNVRTGPSTENSTLGIMLSSSYKVEILETVFTDSKHYDTIARYPYWSKIKFTYDGKSYTGYVYSNFLTLASQTLVSVGSYVPLTFKTNKNLAYKYVSSDPSVATVTDDNTVKFLKAGTVTIHAYDSVGHYQRIKYKALSDASKYTVENVSLGNITYQSVKVSFNDNDYFGKFEVYVTDTNGKLIKSVVTATNSAVISGLTYSKKYLVYVRGLKETSSSKTYSAPTAAVSFKTEDSPDKPAAVTGVKAVNKSNTTVTISWNSSEKATGYLVYTYNSSTKKYTKIADVSSGATTYNDVSKNSINKTQYAVRAYNKKGNSVIYADYSSIVSYTPPVIKPAKVTSLTCKAQTSNTITLKWNAVKGATTYGIYRYDSSKKKYVKVGTTSKTEYKVSSLKSNTSYKFKIRAAIKVYSTYFTGDYSAVKTFKTSPAAVSKIYLTKVTASSYYLKWDKVSGATGYRVCVYDSKTKTYKKLKSTTKNYIKISNLKAGEKTYYKIMSYNQTEDKIYYGDLSDSFCATTLPKKATGITSSNVTKNSVKLTWTKAVGATGYRVYKYDTKTKKYTLVAKTTKNYVTLKKLSANTTYRYVVKSVSRTKDCAYYSDYSAVYKVKTKK